MRTFLRKSVPFLLILSAVEGLALALALPSAAAPSGKNFTMRLYAAFLEPGLGGTPAAPGDEIALGPLEWTGPASGRAAFTLWHQNGWVEFTTTPDRTRLLALRTDAEADPQGRALTVWRHRHGYRVEPGKGAFWHTLEDGPSRMDPALAAGYDRFVLGVRRLWCERALERALAVSAVEPLTAAGDPGLLEKPLFLQYDKNGLIGTPGSEFYIRPWHMPMRIRFRIRRHTPNHESDWIIAQVGPTETTYDAAEWRRRRGYRKTAAGYAWDADFPDRGLSAAEWGPRLDDLMQRSQQYWAEAGLTIVLQGLNNQLGKAIEELGRLSASDRPALDSLRKAASPE